MMIVVSCRVLFFKQKTAYEMRMSDWSSDVCSSDLQTGPVRISLGDKPREANGLKFPHDIHLDPQGGAARMAIRLGHVGGSSGGYGSTLACKDCHAPNAGGIGFAQIDMEADCESCHSLVYDKVGSTFRNLRHGDVREAQADL